MVDSNLNQMDRVMFQDKPSWKNRLLTKEKCCLYVPAAYNFDHVDGVILRLDDRDKKAHLYPIQITLSLRHKASDSDFYSTMYPNWIKPIEDEGFAVESTFVWIDKKEPSVQSHPGLSRNLHSGNRTVRCRYNSTHIRIGRVDEKLAKHLKSACKLIFDLPCCLTCHTG